MSNRYDPALVAEIWRRRPLHALGRWLLFGYLAVALLLRARLGSLLAPGSPTDRQRRAAIRFREALVRLGPTFIKLGQLLSTRADLLPLTYVRELELLQDQVPPFPHEVAMRTLREELGADAATLFTRLSPAPISAASIAQVYRGTLPSGEEVAVKIQRPDLLDHFYVDIGILRMLARWAQGQDLKRFGLPLSVDMPFEGIVDRLAVSLFEQTDFVQEGRNLELFRAHFHDFPRVSAPKPYWEYTTERVLTEEFIEGCRFSDFHTITETYGLDFMEIANLGVRSFIKQVLEDGWFHADTHPGNVLVKPDGTVVFIDFGMVDEIPLEDQPILVDLFLSIVKRDYDAFIDGLIALGFLPAAIDRARVMPIVDDVYTTQMGLKGDRAYTLREILDKVVEVVYDYPFTMPERFTFLMRSVASMEGVVLANVARYYFLDVGLPFAGKLLLSPERKHLRDKLIQDLMPDQEVDLPQLRTLFAYATKEPTFRVGELLGPGLAFLLADEARGFRLALSRGLLAPAALEPGGPVDEIVSRLLQDPSFDLYVVLQELVAFLATHEGQAWLAAIAPRLGFATPDTALARLVPCLLTGLLEHHRFDELVALLVPALTGLLDERAGMLQPFLDLAASWLEASAGRQVLHDLAVPLMGLAPGLRREVLELGLRLLEHPDLDLSPAVGEAVRFATAPEAEPWRALALTWWSSGDVDPLVLPFLARAGRDSGVRRELMGATWPTLRFLVSGASWDTRLGMLDAAWQRLRLFRPPLLLPERR